MSATNNADNGSTLSLKYSTPRTPSTYRSFEEANSGGFACNTNLNFFDEQNKVSRHFEHDEVPVVLAQSKAVEAEHKVIKQHSAPDFADTDPTNRASVSFEGDSCHNYNTVFSSRDTVSETSHSPSTIKRASFIRSNMKHRANSNFMNGGGDVRHRSDECHVLTRYNTTSMASLRDFDEINLIRVKHPGFKDLKKQNFGGRSRNRLEERWRDRIRRKYHRNSSVFQHHQSGSGMLALPQCRFYSQHSSLFQSNAFADCSYDEFEYYYYKYRHPFANDFPCKTHTENNFNLLNNSPKSSIESRSNPRFVDAVRMALFLKHDQSPSPHGSVVSFRSLSSIDDNSTWTTVKKGHQLADSAESMRTLGSRGQSNCFSKELWRKNEQFRQCLPIMTIKLAQEKGFGTIWVSGVLILLSILTLLMAYMGLTNLKECPIQNKIPVYLLVGGCSGFLKVMLLVLKNRQLRKEDMAIDVEVSTVATVSNLTGQDTDVYTTRSTKITEGLLTFFLAIWFGLGNYWVWSIYWPRFEDNVPMEFPQRWCSRTVYLFSLVQIYITHAMLSVLVFSLFIIGCCLKHGQLMESWL